MTRSSAGPTAFALLLIALSLSIAPTAAPSETVVGCNISRRYVVADPARVYAIPGGCVWLARPNSRQRSPLIMVRLNGRTTAHQLSRAPLGKALAICWVEGFTVTWPIVTVATTNVLFGGANGGCGGEGATTWVVRWRNGRFVPLFSSPGYAHPY